MNDYSFISAPQLKRDPLGRHSTITMDNATIAPSHPVTQARRPWVAVVLTILLPGLGHLYGGVPGRAFIVWLLSMMVGVGAVWVAVILPPRFSIPWILLAGAFFLTAVAWDAAQSARRSGTDFVLRRYNRWYVYVAVFLAVGLFVQPYYADLLRSFLQAYKIPSGAMEPTLLAGDHILAKRIGKTPSRGDVVIYRSKGFSVVKRVVALGGDTVAMREGTLFVNRASVPERYARQPSEPDLVAPEFSWQRQFLPKGLDSSRYQPTLSTWGPLVVPPRQYFILGDNRGESADSRYYGFVPSDSINQVPTLVYFSRDPESGSIRWGRIGRLPR